MSRNVFTWIVGAACELLTIDDPFREPYHPPEIVATYVDDRGRPVYKVRADNYWDATNVAHGTTYPGDVSRVSTKTGPKTWFIHYEDWRTGDSDIMGDDFAAWLDKYGIPK
jgi:hypothetical protein